MTNNNEALHQEQKIKELIEKIEELERKNNSFPSREQQLKVLDEITKRDISSNINLLKYLGASETEINFFTTSITTTTRVGCGVTYDFRDRENPFKDYFASFVMRFSGAFEKNARLEKDVKNLKNQKEENETLTKKNADLTESLDHQKARAENAEQKIKELEVELEETELKEKTHIEAFEVSERWNKGQKETLKKDLADKSKEAEEKSKFLQNTRDELEKEKSKNKELKDEVNEERIMKEKFRKELEKEKEQNRELRWESHLDKKPLPKTPIKLKIIKAKIKFQQLIEKTKCRSQELIARIEVKTK